MRYTEQNYPLLRFLKWTDSIIRHPEMKRQREDVKKNKMITTLPFLTFQTSEALDSYNRKWSEAYSIRKIIFEHWPELQQAFSSKIEIISKNFLFAMDRSYDAFLKPELFEEITGEFKGTLILPSGEAICYDFEMADPKWLNGKLIYGIAGQAIRLHSDGNTLVMAVIDDIAYDAEKAHKIDRHEESAEGIFDIILVYTLFKKYAEIKEVEAKSIKRTMENVPEVKTTLNGISFLDVSWFTTIIRTEGFGVRGHFRLQPYGPGKTEKRLIYINEYQKHGYVRKARIQNIES